MDFRQFRYFVAAAEELHFGRAAERLGIAQPAMSQQIKLLEDQMGVRLFSRAKKRVELTEAGLSFLTEIRMVLTSADKAISIAQDTARGEMGKIVIGFVGSVMFRPTFPHLLKDYRTRHPGVQLVLHEMAAVRQIDAVLEQHMDIAIVRGPLQSALPDGLTSYILAKHRLVAVLPINHPLAAEPTLELSQLANEAFLVLDDSSKISFTPVLQKLCREAGFEPSISLRLSEVATLIHLVGAGHGVSIIPDLAAQLNLPDVHFAMLSGTEAYSELLVVSRKFERSEAVQSLLAQIRKLSTI
jgi:DNA-binding transcriptional LysR family regulator